MKTRAKIDPVDASALKPKGPPAIGNLVHASESPEFDLLKHGAVGLLLEIIQTQAGRLYRVGRTRKDWFGIFRHIRKITVKEASEILRGAREQRMEAEAEKGSIGDQIRAFLREEALKRPTGR